MRRLLLAIISVFILSGCNTSFQGSFQKIVINTPGV
ncbi:MAG: lipoprotein [Alphaproteobacteria bacterium]|nr:lipoprotein [Alphaproteobacteria bacterium]